MKSAFVILGTIILVVFAWMRIESVALVRRSVHLSSPAEVKYALLTPFRQQVEFNCDTMPKAPSSWVPIKVEEIAGQEGVSLPSQFANRKNWDQMTCFAQSADELGGFPYSGALISSPDGKRHWLYFDQGW